MKKSRTGIEGLDEVTKGGLPYGRPTLVCGGPGCGKSTLSMEYLIQGALELDEPGLLFSFEQSEQDIIQDFSSLHGMIPELVQKGKLYIEYIDAGPAGQAQAGEFTLDALFLRIEAALSRVKGRRVVLDTVESLFQAFPDKNFMRHELRRLFTWFKEREITTVITGEAGEHSLTRWGLEEYITDCVISIDHRIEEQSSTRRLRIIKYRGSAHGTNEYPFLIGEEGVSIIPITSLGLDYSVSSELVSSGIPDLDEMLSGKNGFYRDSTVLISGQAGCGKTSMAACFAASVCAAGESCLYFAFEESPQQILRNMASIGIELQEWLDRGLLSLKAEAADDDRLGAQAPRDDIDGGENRACRGGYRPYNESHQRRLDSGSKIHADPIHGFFERAPHYYPHDTPQQRLRGSHGDSDRHFLPHGYLDHSFQEAQRRLERTALIEIVKSRGMKHCEERRAFILHDGGISIREEGEDSHA
ncbi:MAG: circadian clock protein KaiC [Spirochaetia bacterium]|nr:circadian clock protein KaiC [Spirochaetia bacterium]